jgi:hypothetical protein
MTLKDLYANVGVAQALAPAVQSAATEGGAIDLRDYGSVVIGVNTGAIVSAGDFGVKLQHSDTTTGGDFVDAPAGVVSSNAPATLAAASAYKLKYVGSKRYVRLALTKAGGTSIALGAVAILGHPAVAPVA